MASQPAAGSGELQAQPNSVFSDRDWLLLLGLWLVAVAIDGVWLWLDQAPPAWDQGDHLTRSLNYWRLFQPAYWGSEDWWTQLWRLSPTYRAPFVYLLTVPVLELLGRGFDQAVLVNSLLMGALLGLVYWLGRHLFNRRTGLWAAMACILLPCLTVLRTDYLLDYGLVVCTLLALTCLTCWRDSTGHRRWLWAAGLGLGLGLIVLTKLTGILIVIAPLVWVGTGAIWRRRWLSLLQLLLAGGLAIAICWPWFQTNWLTVLTSTGQSNATWMPAEVVPGSLWSAWTYYARMIPRMVTVPLFWGGLGAWLLTLILALVGSDKTNYPTRHWPFLPPGRGAWLWLLGIFVAAYGLLSLFQNKDIRHFTPVIPVLVLLLLVPLTHTPGRGWRLYRWGVLTLATLTMLGAMFPLPHLPRGKLVRHPYQGTPWPHPEIVQTVIAEQPYLRSTIGVLPNTPQVNPMNVDFYGELQDFRVYGREVGFNSTFVPLDAASLDWVLVKSGDQGVQNPGNPAKADLQAQVETSPDLRVINRWDTPDQSQLVLYGRQPWPVVVEPLQIDVHAVSLTAVDLPAQVAPGTTVPVTYQVTGPWTELRNGLLLLTWERSNSDSPTGSFADGADHWIHDHGLGRGQLYPGLGNDLGTQAFEVTERLGMILPPNLQPGQYQLRAQWLNRVTGQGVDWPIPDVAVQVTANAPAGAAPMPDLLSQIHALSGGLADGTLDPIFTTVGRINQYDPIQDYLVQAEVAMEKRLKSDPDNLEWLYTRALAQVLQQKADAAILSLTQIANLSPDNVYPWLYLGFVELYSWHPGRASQALDRAEVLAPDMPEVQALQGIAQLQRGNLWGTWQRLKASGLIKS